MSNRTIIAAIAFTALTGAAFAQSPTPPGSSTAQSSSAAGMTMAEKASVAVRFKTISPAQVMTSKLVGAKVYNNQNDNLGDIVDLVVENGETITGVVVKVGGFLGMGKKYVVLDPSTIVLNRKGNDLRAFVDTSKDNLKSAPAFAYKNKG